MTVTKMITHPGTRRVQCEIRHARRARRLEGFQAGYRHALHGVSVDKREIEDLADSFPALLFALATGYGTARARARTIKLVESGVPLRKAAAALGLPWWLRKLAPASFVQPIGALPSGPGIDTRLAQLAPSTATLASVWLERISYAKVACDDRFALWIARQHRLGAPEALDEQFVYLTAWAWFAGQDDTLGHRILRKPWTPAIGLRRSLDEIGIWRRRIAMVSCLGSGVTDTWINEGQALGYEFKALRNIEDFINESIAMDNCLDQYSEHLADGAARIFSVRKNGKSVADVEIGPHPEEARMPAVLQLRGQRNRRAPPEIWQATFAWLGSERVRPVPNELGRHKAAAKHREARKAFWQPYLDALKGTGHEERFKLIVLGGARQRAALSRRNRAHMLPTGGQTAAPLLTVTTNR